MAISSHKKPLDQESAEFNAIFKVFFEGASDPGTKGFTLTFFRDDTALIRLENVSTFLMKYNELARKKSAFMVNNIKEVLPLGKATKAGITQFQAVLYTIKTSGGKSQRKGMLIGNHKDQGFILLGIWPHSAIKQFSRNAETYDKILNQIVQNPENFSDLLLIT